MTRALQHPLSLATLCCTSWLLAGAAAGPTLPVALVFEGSAYAERLRGVLAGTSLFELIECSHPTYCQQLGEDIESRIEAVIGQPRDITALTRWPRLRLVQSTSYMYPQLAKVPLHAAVASYNPPWRDVYGAEPIAEFVIAAAFDWNYRLRERSAVFSACAWAGDAPQACPPTDELTAHPVLMNQTMGVLGYGKIGEMVARRAAALGMRVVATKAHGPFSPPPAPLTWLSDDNDRLFQESDFIAVTLPGSVQGIVNKTSLGLMKRGAVVIPVSAGPIDYDALYEALKRRAIGGAVLDSWPHGCWQYPEMACGPPYGSETAPFAGGEIQKMDNVVALPGMAMRDAKFWTNSASFVGENLVALASGQALAGIVRKSTPPTKPTGAAIQHLV